MMGSVVVLVLVAPAGDKMGCQPVAGLPLPGACYVRHWVLQEEPCSVQDPTKPSICCGAEEATASVTQPTAHSHSMSYGPQRAAGSHKTLLSEVTTSCAHQPRR